jgi:hypothetical protein
MYHHQFGEGFRGWRRGGVFFPPLLPLLIGVFVLFLIIQSGLWFPLLLIGIVVWIFSPLRRRWWNGGFNSMGRMPKREFSTRHFYADPTLNRTDDIEYV